MRITGFRSQKFWKTVKVLVIASLLNSACSFTTRGQVPDTLANMQQMVNNKAYFIGKPFSVLKDSLKMDLRFFIPGRGRNNRKVNEDFTAFGFYFPEADDMYLAYPLIEIEWQIPFCSDQSDSLFILTNGGEWSQAVSEFYEFGVVKDIYLLELD